MRRIERLSESVINRIAAGEVVQRPSAALKELLENALDAGSTSIQVLAQDGGMGVLQVTDDGHGIHRDDLPLLCERYATSKLRSFEGLRCISTFGFRGEALSSISYVSRVTVTTMRRACSDETAPDSFAWRCQYVDGAMQGEPTPCAGNPGTSIRVEKMFYNSAVRRRALNRPSEEYGRIVAVVSRYALAFPHVAFLCRREGSGGGKTDVFFPKGSTTLANIRLFHGTTIASHLHELKCTGAGASSGTQTDVLAATDTAGENCFLITGYTSGMALPNRKPYLCVFVNNRLVESAAIKRALDIVYSGILTGGNRPFTVLFITVPPDRVDVNIHPTKHEVCLLDEEMIVAQLSENVRLAVMESAARRQLDTRNILSKAAALGDKATHKSQCALLPSSVGGVTAAPCTLVRVEPQRGALDAYVRRVPTLQKESTEAVLLNDGDKDIDRGTRDSQECSPVVKLEETVPQEEQQESELLDVPTIPPAEKVPVSVFASALKSSPIDDGGGCTDALRGIVKKEVDEDDEDEDFGYVMQHFKRHRKEIQKVVGLKAEQAEETEEEEAKDPVHLSGGTTTTTTTTAAAAAATPHDRTVGALPEGREDLLLTSVATILADIRQVTSSTAQSLFERLAYVGVVNAHLFLAQSGTTLYAVDTLRLVRLVVYQRIFLRWSFASLPAPPQLVLREPVRVADLLRFAQQHDVPSTPGALSAEEAQQTVRRMDRRLHHWRCMLLEYFAIEITNDGLLVALPLGLNASWPPVPRVVPLFMWRLAAEVPYGEDEVACFTAIARHIAGTLYGMRLHDAWVAPHLSPSPSDAATRDEGDVVPPVVDAIRFGLLQCAASPKFFVPPADALTDGTVQVVVSVEELYKVFERC